MLELYHSRSLNPSLERAPAGPRGAADLPAGPGVLAARAAITVPCDLAYRVPSADGRRHPLHADSQEGVHRGELGGWIRARYILSTVYMLFASEALKAQRLVELRDRWLCPPEWVEWVDEPVARLSQAAGSSRRGRREGAPETHSDEPLQRQPAVARRCARGPRRDCGCRVRLAGGHLRRRRSRELLALNRGGQ